MPRRKNVTGSLNSKNPNPFELAYKELWDKLPQSKKDALTEDRVTGKYTYSSQVFAEAVSKRAEELFAEKV